MTYVLYGIRAGDACARHVVMYMHVHVYVVVDCADGQQERERERRMVIFSSKQGQTCSLSEFEDGERERDGQSL